MKNRSPNPNPKTFKECILEDLSCRINSGEIRTPQPHHIALDHLFRSLGAKAAHFPKDMLPAWFAQVDVHLLNSGLPHATIRLYGRIIRSLLADLVRHGLNPKCITALTIPRREGTGEPAGGMVQKSHLKIILKLVESQIETLRILIWLALSGVSSLRDAVFLELAGVDWATGLISYRRQKSGQLVQFGALPPLLELLKLRKVRFGPGAIYALPELIYTAAELRNPACNTVAGKTSPEPIAARATVRARQVVNEFFALCGFQAAGITFKSLGRHIVSFWHAIGLSEQTCLRMAGYRTEAHSRFDRAPEIEISRAAELTWHYLEAIREERDFLIPTTFELLAALTQQRVQLEQKLDAQQSLMEECRNHLVRLVPPAT